MTETANTGSMPLNPEKTFSDGLKTPVPSKRLTTKSRRYTEKSGFDCENAVFRFGSQMYKICLRDWRLEATELLLTHDPKGKFKNFNRSLQMLTEDIYVEKVTKDNLSQRAKLRNF